MQKRIIRHNATIITMTRRGRQHADIILLSQGHDLVRRATSPITTTPQVWRRMDVSWADEPTQQSRF